MSTVLLYVAPLLPPPKKTRAPELAEARLPRGELRFVREACWAATMLDVEKRIEKLNTMKKRP